MLDCADVQPMMAEGSVLEQRTTFRFEWGGGGVIAEIPSAVDRSVHSVVHPNAICSA